MRIAVVGGTGLIGRHVVEAAAEAGHEPVVLARSCGVDATTGAGLDDALTGVDVVIDVANRTTTRRRAAVAFFETTTHTLMSAEERAGVRHHVVLSIVGIDGVRLGYYRGKVRQEQVALAGAVPASVLRSTQFHEFVGQVLDRMKGPLVIVPQMRVQPIAAREVARALVELAAGEPAGRAADLAGPQEESLPDLARGLLRHRGSRKPVLGVRLPGSAGRAMARGDLLPAGPGPRGLETFDEWLPAH